MRYPSFPRDPRLGNQDWSYRDEYGDSVLRGDYGGTFDVGGPLPAHASTMKAAAYRGLGPRGYRRSDQRIREDVCDALTDDAQLDASDLEVEVKDGEVTLSGTVASRSDKRHAESVAEMITGVKDVYNHLRVVLRDEDLTQKGEPSSPMSPQNRTL